MAKEGSSRRHPVREVLEGRSHGYLKSCHELDKVKEASVARGTSMGGKQEEMRS